MRNRFRNSSVILILTLVLCPSVLADIVQECTEINHQYALARDLGDTDAYARLFAEDAEFLMEGDSYRGRAELIKRLSGGESESFARLLITTVNIKDNYDGTATGVVYFIMFQTPVGNSKELPITSFNIFMGEYHDTYQQTEQGCQIVRRETIPTFLGVE